MQFEDSHDQKKLYKTENQLLGEAIELQANSRALKFSFKKFSEGVYIYGSKCVTIKLEDGQLMAKVGGGWMHIDTFIETYEGLEEEKFKMNSSRDFSNNDKL